MQCHKTVYQYESKESALDQAQYLSESEYAESDAVQSSHAGITLQ